MLSRATHRADRHEAGAALVAAIALTVLGALIITAIMVSSKSSSNSARERLDAAASEVLARDASAVMSDAFSDLEASELDGFVIDRTILQRHADRLGAGARVIANSDSAIPTELRRVDAARVPSAGQFTLVQPLDESRLGYWQVFSSKVPTWGTTPGARVTAYVRTWATPATGGGFTTRPMIYRVELRPTWFADFQMLFDGPFRLGDGATVSGRIHSNGYEISRYNQYQGSHVNAGVWVDSTGTFTCRDTARISSARGAVNTGCPSSQERGNTGTRYNLLRAREFVDRLRSNCGVATSGINLICTDTSNPVRVVLGGSSVQVEDTVTGRTWSGSAGVVGDRPGQVQGAVVLTDGDATLSGSLGSGSRGMLVTASRSDSASYGTGSAPSVRIRTSSPVGSLDSSVDKSSSFGIVAEGDLVLDQVGSCNIRYNGAVVTITGMVTSNPTYTVPFPLPTPGPRCGNATVVGSMVGHYPPGLTSSNGGFLTRNYAYLNSLYDNPPPLYPTVGDWEITRLAPADLGCFASGTLNTEARSGCV